MQGDFIALSDGAPAAPWLSFMPAARSPHGSALLHLHNEILSFAAFCVPSEAEKRAAERTVAFVSDTVRSVESGATLRLFGSRETRTALPHSDVDCVVVSRGGREPS